MYVGQGQSQPIVQDSGSAGGGPIGMGLAEQLLSVRSPTNTYPAANAGTGPLGTNWCNYDGPTTGPYHYFCLSPNAQGGGLMTYGFGGGATALPFNFNLNGTTYPFPFVVGGIIGPGTTGVNDLALWNNTSGTLLKDVSLPTLCASNLFGIAQAGCVPPSGGGTATFLRADGAFAAPAAGGTNGQIQYNNSGVPGGFTASGDATVNTSTGAVTFTTVNSSVGTFSATCMQLSANGKGLLTAIVRGICGLNAQNADYSIATSDCGSIVTEANGPFTVTLPAAAGFSSGCVVKACNLNANDATHHAMRLSGFPASVRPRLWMQQCVEVTQTAGAWTPTLIPSVFVPNYIPSVYVDPAGSDANDGMLSNITTNAIASVQTCFTILQQEMEIFGGPPSCLLTSGAVFNSTTINFVRGHGYGIVNLFGNGGIATLRTSTNLVLEMYDFAGYIISANIQYDCSFAGSHPCFGFFLHQQNGVDFGSGNAGSTFPNYFNGGNTGDLAIWCDSQCKINSAQPLNFSGTWGTGLRLDLSSVASINAGMSVNGASFGGPLMQITGGSQLLWSGTLALGTSFPASRLFYVSNAAAMLSTFTTTGTAGGGTQSYLVINNGILCNAGAAIPGTAGATTAAGAAAGIVPAGSGATCSP